MVALGGSPAHAEPPVPLADGPATTRDATQSASPAEVLDEARRALEQGEPGRAVDLLESLARTAPADALPLFLESCRRAQRFEVGRAVVDDSDVEPSAPPQVTIAVAQWEAEEGWVRRAGERLDAALALAPDAAPLWEARARLARSAGDPHRAREAADRAITAGADPLDLAWLRGEAAIELGEPEVGKQILGELVAATPGHLGARLALARLARADGDRALAANHCWQVLELEPDHVAALGELGTLLVRDPDAREVGTRLLQRFREGRDRRERIERRVRERREGRDSPALRIELARAYRLDGRPAVARAVALDGIEAVTDGAARSALLAEAGLAARALGDVGGALRALGAAVSLDRSRDDLRIAVVELLLSAGDVRRASDVLERTGSSADPRRRAWAEIEILARRGAGWDLLAPRLRALVEGDPADPSAARALIDAAVGLGRTEEVEAFLRGQVDLTDHAGGSSLVTGFSAQEIPLLALAWVREEIDPDEPWLREAEELLTASRDTDVWLWIESRRRRRGDLAGAQEAARRALHGRILAGSSRRTGEP